MKKGARKIKQSREGRMELKWTGYNIVGVGASQGEGKDGNGIEWERSLLRRRGIEQERERQQNRVGGEGQEDLIRIKENTPHNIRTPKCLSNSSPSSYPSTPLYTPHLTHSLQLAAGGPVVDEHETRVGGGREREEGEGLDEQREVVLGERRPTERGGPNGAEGRGPAQGGMRGFNLVGGKGEGRGGGVDAARTHRRRRCAGARVQNGGSGSPRNGNKQRSTDINEGGIGEKETRINPACVTTT
ncbi:hypothetical protein DFH09DRAFT_1074892 [Mycena vulgaris]|nr:hypothetical protein DFH09DRAFT_1074892 [Mycena vulgaris]